ncbi:hypothetical protein EMCRGX_G024025 [Ephydatia muelleri]
MPGLCGAVNKVGVNKSGDSPVASSWALVDETLQSYAQKHTFPGYVAGVANKSGFIYLSAYGSFTYGDPAPVTNTNPPMTPMTLFDMASLTKVLSTTTAVMLLYQWGHLNLDMKVSDPRLLGPGFAVNGKGDISLKNLLLHNAGYPPDPSPNYWDASFGCPQTANYHPAEDFSCQAQIYAALLNQTLVYPVGSQYIYSDLSMITMKYVVGILVRDLGYVEDTDLNYQCVHGRPDLAKTAPYFAQCYYEAFVRVHVFEFLDLDSTGFLPPLSSWGDCAPTWNDTVYRHELMQGFVSDGNAYALGGISGHAGLFSTVGDVQTLLYSLMFATSDDGFINSTTVKTFTTVYNATQSSRALGWDTQTFCGNLSATTYTHTGYTGTQVCNDPERNIITILLTNRCYPNDPDTLITQARIDFNNAVKTVVDSL